MKFKNAVDIISGGTPKTDISEYWNGEIKWISVVDIVKVNKYLYDTEKKITKAGLENSNTKMLQKNDIIISARGTVGALGVLNSQMCFNQSCFGLRGKEGIIDQDYLYYYLKYYIINLKKKTQGSVFETINLDTFNFIDLEIPNIKDQIKTSNF